MQRWQKLPIAERRRYVKTLRDLKALEDFLKEHQENEQELLLAAQAASELETFYRQLKEAAARRVFLMGTVAVAEIADSLNVTRPTVYKWGNKSEEQTRITADASIAAEMIDIPGLIHFPDEHR